ncbi:DUF3078 domain-containing protein [candidate division KSB1 bacterium]|nr:MAG: DUF3078 domain-containing protein [candidate division KSB1 bacterium]
MSRAYLPVVVFIILSLAGQLFAADSVSVTANPWKIQFETGIGVTQAAYSDNWTGGEAGSIIWVAGFRGKADKQLMPSWWWGNELKLAFGQIHSQNKDTKEWAKPQKAADKIRYDGILRLTRGWVVDPYLSGIFESQFLDASGSKKRYVNPIDLTEAAGVARDIIKVPDKNVLTTRLGAGFRQHMVTMDDPADPDKTISETTNDGGLEWVTDWQLGSAKAKYSFVSQLTLFQALFNSRSDELNNDWKTVDMNWDNMLRANLTSILQVSLAWQLLYDKEISKAGRFKETLTLGVAYKFANFTEEKK